jgi:hypothetical protein
MAVQLGLGRGFAARVFHVSPSLRRDGQVERYFLFRAVCGTRVGGKSALRVVWEVLGLDNPRPAQLWKSVREGFEES